jgi:hypothetical protein
MIQGFRSRDEDEFPFSRKPRDKFPNYPFIINNNNYIEAKCPKCGRITSIRTCYGCKELMCEECLIEHQIICLHK